MEYLDLLVQSAIPTGLHKKCQAELSRSVSVMWTKLCIATSRLRRKELCVVEHAGSCHISASAGACQHSRVGALLPTPDSGVGEKVDGGGWYKQEGASTRVKAGRFRTLLPFQKIGNYLFCLYLK